MDEVRYFAIGSKTVQGKAWLNNTVQDFAYQSYNICCGKGDVWGDGVTPLECALGKDELTTGHRLHFRSHLFGPICNFPIPGLLRCIVSKVLNANCRGLLLVGTTSQYGLHVHTQCVFHELYAA
jgi:hypothetical protein